MTFAMKLDEVRYEALEEGREEGREENRCEIVRLLAETMTAEEIATKLKMPKESVLFMLEL